MPYNKWIKTTEKLQKEVGDWSDETFPHANFDNLMRHINLEVEELATARDLENMAEECADVVLLIMHLAHKHNINLGQAIVDKYEAIQKREWMEPDEHGIVRHK